MGKIITFFIIRDLNIIKYKINEYVLLFIYIHEINNKIKKFVRVYFLFKIYIVSNFKANILINNDIINLKNI